MVLFRALYCAVEEFSVISAIIRTLWKVEWSPVCFFLILNYFTSCYFSIFLLIFCEGESDGNGDSVGDGDGQSEGEVEGEGESDGEDEEGRLG